MKRLLSFVTAAVMSLCVLTSCGENDSSSKADTSKSSSESSGERSSSSGKKIAKAAIGLGAMVLVPSMTGYVNKSQQRSAASNAKLIYVSVNTVLADYEADGKQIRSDCAGKKIRFSQLKDSTDFDKEVARYIGWDERYDDTLMYFEIKDGRVNNVSWQKNDSSPVGYYPQKTTGK